jgi:peptidyl-prolyl cis-trans isomerase C
VTMAAEFRASAAALVVAGVMAAGATAPAAAGQSRQAIVARADGVDVSRGELEDEIIEARTSGDIERTQLTLTVDGLDAFARSMVERKLLAARARAVGLDKDPDVARRLERELTRMLAEALVGQTRALTDVSPGAVEAFYRRNGDRLSPAPRRKTRHIVVDTETEALALRADVQDLASFEAVARRVNTDGSGSRGGDLGWIAPGTMVRAFDGLVFSTSPRVAAGPVRTSRGWHLVYVEDVDPGQLAPLDLIRDRVVDLMKRDAVDALLRDVRDRTAVTVVREQLADILK